MSIKIKQRKPYLVKEVGEWKFTFHYKEGSIDKTFLSITCDSGMFNCRIGGRNEMFYFLLHVAMKDDIAVLHDYITRVACLASIWDDTKLASEVNNALNDWHKRRDAKGAKKAKAVTDSEEMASQAFMESVVERSQMSKKELKAKREADREMMKEILNENKESENEE